MRNHFLGLAANYSKKQCFAHTFAIGTEKDRDELAQYLEKRYGGKAILCKNGRSALALSLKAYFDKGDAVIVNGFTCYAVYEAVKAAGLIPVFADISKDDLNFDVGTLENLLRAGPAGLFTPAAPPFGSSAGTLPSPSPAHLKSLEDSSHRAQVKGIIIQNTLGNPVDMVEIEKFARKHKLTIIEDLAHSTGVRYPDGREAGTVGAAAVFSFGKDKSIDTVSGGALVLRDHCKNLIEAPSKLPKISDNLRTRFYPLLGALCRCLTRIHLGGILMKILIKIHWVERSADNKLDLSRKIAKFEAKMALAQFKNLKKSGEPPLREFCLVDNRSELLSKLKASGYYLNGFWYEKPVSPERYYKAVHFPESKCQNAVDVSKHIINLPTYYPQHELRQAREIVKQYLIKEGK